MPQPKLPSALANDLAASSDRVGELASADSCEAAEHAADLRDATIESINRGRVPAGLQEELLSRVNALAASIACGDPVPVASAQKNARDLSDWLRLNAGG